MSLIDNLKKSNILIKPVAKNRWGLLEEMIELATKNKDIATEDSEAIKSALIEREKSMSTVLAMALQSLIALQIGLKTLLL
jgi:mannitol/fructose-specific phosphotransferase system IIA component (Ntr-type)